MAINFKRLKTSVDYNFSQMSTYRENRYKSVKQYVGANYSKNGSILKMPVNLMMLATCIFAQRLVSSNPKAFITNNNKSLRPQAVNLGLACNQVIEEINYKRTMQLVVLDALFGMGIVKKGMTSKSQIEFNGFTHDIGQCYIDHIDLDDFVIDMSSKMIDQCSFMGNKYRRPYDLILNSGLYDPEIIKKIKREKSIKYRKSSESGGDEEIEGISRCDGTYDEETYLDYIDLIDLWLPYEGKFITMPYSPEGSNWDVPLREIDYEGPENGPYNILGFHDVPGQLLPLPPASNWIELNEIANKLFRKLGRQADRAKTILGVMKGAEKDGKGILNANDGEAIGVTSPDKCREFKFGGVDNVGLAFFLQVKQLFSYHAGNLDSLGGLGAMSETVGQDKLMSESSSATIKGMQARVYDFSKQDIKDIAWYLWYDPFVQIPFTKPVKGTDIEIPYIFTEEDKEGDFLDLNFSIVPYSMQEDTPATKIAKLQSIMQNHVLPLTPQMQQQGVMLNVTDYIEFIGRLSNMPELQGMFIYAEPNPSQNEQPIGNPGSKFSHRINERINRPGATLGGQANAAIAALSGMNSGQQTSQAASMMESVA